MYDVWLRHTDNEDRNGGTQRDVGAEIIRYCLTVPHVRCYITPGTWYSMGCTILQYVRYLIQRALYCMILPLHEVGSLMTSGSLIL